MKKVILIIIVSVLLIFIILNILLTLVFGRKVNKQSIINKYKNNVEAFNKSLAELTEENIYFNREILSWGKGKIIITIHEELEDGSVNVITVNENDYNKYQETISLMETLNIKRIHKSGQNIMFQFNAMIKFSQEIVKLRDEEYYIWSGHIIQYKESLGDDWYYVECR